MKRTFIAWVRANRRSEILAARLGATLHYIQYGRRKSMLHALWRYTAQALHTWWVLWRERPRLVFVQNPPIFGVLACYLYTRLFGADLVIDSHTGTFTAARWKWSLKLHRWLSARARATIVHNRAQEQVVRAWDVPYCVLGFLEGEYPVGLPFPLRDGFSVAFVCSFNGDEPVEAVFGAAASLPDVTVYVTGDASHLPPEVHAGKPTNCQLTGYLSYEQYIGLLRGVDAVLVLTTRSNSLLLGGFEAVSLEKPLLVSDTVLLRECFTRGTVYVPNTSAGIAAGIREAQREIAGLAKEMTELRAQLQQQGEVELARLERLIMSTAPVGEQEEARVKQPREHVLMLLENNPFPQDGRVFLEARTLTEAGLRVTVIAPRSNEQPLHETVEGIAVYRFPAPPEGQGFLGYFWEYGYSTFAIWMISLWVWVRRGFDVVHTHNPPDTLVIVAAFYKLLGKRFVFDHHDLAPEMYRVLFGMEENLIYRLLVALERLSCRLADHIIATNHSYKRVQMERSGVPEERITIVRNGPDVAIFHSPTRVESPPQEKYLIGYAGEMGFQDGVDVLLRVLHHLVHEMGRRDVSALLVGRGAAFETMRTLATQLQLDEVVTFTGRLPHPEVVRRLAAVDLCVAPEPRNEYNDRSTMIKLMEYMALGKPTVAFDLTEHRESAGDAACYARPNDEADFARLIACLLDDPQRRDEMGQVGRKRVEQGLAWHHQAVHLLEAYRTLTGTSRDLVPES